MLKSFIILLGFIAYQIVASAIAMVWAVSTSATPDDVVTPSAHQFAVGMAIAAVLFVAMLWAAKGIRRRPFNSAGKQPAGTWLAAIAGFTLFAFGSLVAVGPLRQRHHRVVWRDEVRHHRLDYARIHRSAG